MFMRPGTFRRRMEILRRNLIPVVSLEEGLRRLNNKTVRHGETVITLDDGWASNLTIALPILEQFRFPACIYVSTEHLSSGTQAFNVALYYMIYKSQRRAITLYGVHPAVDGSYDLTDPAVATAQIVQAAEATLSLEERQHLLPSLAHSLGVDAADVFKDGRFTFLNANQIKQLAERGVAIELHSHTHRLAADSFDSVASEISLNRDALSQILGRQPNHFCYPSGVHAEAHPEWLARLNISSATTCDPGLNPYGTSPMLLKRYLDSDAIDDIVFEAEVCGLRDIVRNALLRINHIISA